VYYKILLLRVLQLMGDNTTQAITYLSYLNENYLKMFVITALNNRYYLEIILFAYRSLPDIPNVIISMPLIRNAIEIIIANRTNPTEIGCAITRIDTAILRAPTPMRKALDEPEAFFDTPCIILDMPLTSKAIAARTTKTVDVNIGNCISTIEKAIINKPIPILAKRNRL